MKIAIVGTGYVGLTTGTCLAELGNNLICVDIDESKINKLNNNIIPIYEPDLEDLVIKNRKNGRLKFTTDLKQAIKESEIIFICVGTPPKKSGDADLSYVEDVARTIAEVMDSYKVIVEKSTVPVETGEKVAKSIRAYNLHKVDFDVVSNPEFLREGSAVNDFMHPDRIVIGCESEKAKAIMEKLYIPLKAPIIFTDIKSAEIIKHTSNSFLATKISFINTIANICELAGADVEKVAEGMGYDKRIGRAFLNAGIGYGGFCLSGEEFVFLGNPNPKLTNFREAFESSKHVWSSEFDEIESGRYKVLYHEGRTGKPICPYAETHGLKVVYLGRDNPYHLAIVNGDVHEEDEENQRKREGVWLERIQPSYEIEESLLIVGAHHAKDRYGLTTNLLAQRIRLIELFDFFKFSDKLVDRLLEENMNEMTALFRVNKGDLVQIVNRHSLTG